jgi:uncharacterized protein (DUF488 family)
MAKTKKIFTIGYEQVSSRAVLGELEQAGVRLLVDVRAVVSSRRAGFSKTQLAASLKERGIGYIHLRGLGTPKAGRDARRKGDAAAMKTIYGAHLKTLQAEKDMDELADLVKTSGPVCLLCFERDHANCHRRFIAEIIEKRDRVTTENLVAPQF